MYQLTIKNPTNQQQKILSLPLTDLELELELKELGVTNINDPIDFINFAIDDGYGFPQLPSKILEDADIFQINFLTQRIDSLSNDEQKDMATVIDAYGIYKINDLINLIYDIKHETYRIIEEVENNTQLGRWFVEEKCYDMPLVVLDNINYDDVGYELDNYEFQGKFCDKGYVFAENPMTEKIYDGSHFPDFSYDRNYIANIEYVNDENGEVSYLKLPAGEFAMQRALKELQCENFDNCRIHTFTSRILGRNDYLTEKDDIEKLNDLCKDLALLNGKDFSKMQAVTAYAKVSGEEMFYRLGAQNDTAFEKLSALYSHIDDFDFFLGIHSPEAYADHLVNVIKFLEIGEELIPYINYEELGRDWIEGEGGKFVPGGYVIDESPIETERVMPEETQELDEEDLEI